MNKAEEVHEITKECLYTDEEVGALGSAEPLPPEVIKVEGLVRNFGFKPERIAEHKERIRALLDAMPDTFHKTGGGGMTFLNLCMDKDGTHWAEHPTMEQLVVLAIAADLGGYCMSRDMWNVLPERMPYVWFDTRPGEKATT